MDICKRLLTSVVIFLAVFFLQSGLVPATAQAGQMNKKQIAEHWKKLKKNWSPKDMQAALKISKRDSAVFNTLVELKKKDIPWGALQQTVTVCEGRPKWMKEFWEYVKKYKFHPKEVFEVFKKFPPSQTHRFYYFFYRAGGGKGMAQRASAGEDKKKDKKKAKRRKKPRKKVKGYPKEEVLGIFKRTRFDIKLIKKYFEKRKAGIPVQKAWAKIEEEVKAQIADEKKKAEEKQKARMKRQKELAEKKRKLEEYKEKQKKAKEDEGDKKETAKTTTAADLFGDEDEENDEEKNDDKKDSDK